MKIVKCANCEKEINLDTDSQTSCSICEKDFCFAMSSTCFTQYHRKNELYSGHNALSICDPTWKINLRCTRE
jgi:hypothetical protein